MYTNNTNYKKRITSCENFVSISVLLLNRCETITIYECIVRKKKRIDTNWTCDCNYL